MRDRPPETAPRADTPSRDGGGVRFSVIVPVYEHWHLVPALLERLERQTFPRRRFEVILVDNGSRSFSPPSGLADNVCVMRCDKPGSYAARNDGARRARGQWLAFTDADCLPVQDWLAELDRAAARQGPDAPIAGPVEVVALSARPGAWEIYDMVKGIPQERYVARGYAATANLAVSRPLFDRLGGFDAGRFSGGDADFCRRAAAIGHPVVLAKDARVEHPARSTWEEIATKARRVKGGQLAAGSPRRRLMWLTRTMLPPFIDGWRFLRSTRHPLRDRVVAVLVQTVLWPVELAEALRLMFRRAAERR